MALLRLVATFLVCVYAYTFTSPVRWMVCVAWARYFWFTVLFTGSTWTGFNRCQLPQHAFTPPHAYDTPRTGLVIASNAPALRPRVPYSRLRSPPLSYCAPLTYHIPGRIVASRPHTALPPPAATTSTTRAAMPMPLSRTLRAIIRSSPVPRAPSRSTLVPAHLQHVRAPTLLRTSQT